MQSPPVPWLAIAASLPVWAIHIMSFCQGWGFYTLLTEIPSYLNNVLQYSTSSVSKRNSYSIDFNTHISSPQSGLQSALPYMMQFFVVLFGGPTVDFLRKKYMWRTGPGTPGS